MNTLGRHLLVELTGCERDKLSEVGTVQGLMERAAEVAGATIVQSVFHQFNPYGVSGVVVIAESHLAIHTWPEYGYASVDVYTCGGDVDPWQAERFLREALGATDASTQEIFRGQVSDGLAQPSFHSRPALVAV